VTGSVLPRHFVTLARRRQIFLRLYKTPMAGYRRRFRRRFTRRRYAPGAGLARRRRRPTNWIGMARKAYRTATWLAGLVNTEKKFFDTEVSVAPTQAGVLAASLLDIPQGDTAVTRDGRSLRIKSLQISGQVTQSGDAFRTFVRVMLVADLRPNAGEPAPADIIEAGAASNIFALASMANGGRFRTIKNWVFDLRNMQGATIAGASMQGPDQQHFKYYAKMDKVVKYTDGSTDDPQNYNLLLFAFGSEATNTPTLAAECRVRYIDN